MNNVNIIELNDINYFKYINEHKDKLLIIDFWAEWCRPCKSMMIIIKKLSEKLKNNQNIKFITVDIQSNLNIIKEYSIKSVPYLLFIKNNIILNKNIGLTTEEKISNIIENYI